MSIHSFIQRRELDQITEFNGLLRSSADFESTEKTMVREDEEWVSISVMKPCADFEAGLLKKNKIHGKWHTHLPPEWQPSGSRFTTGVGDGI